MTSSPNGYKGSQPEIIQRGCDRLLIVDDDLADRTFLALTLGSTDPDILVGEQGSLAAAAVAVHSERVDCAILDYHLGRVEASESIDSLREAAADKLVVNLPSA